MKIFKSIIYPLAGCVMFITSIVQYTKTTEFGPFLSNIIVGLIFIILGINTEDKKKQNIINFILSTLFGALIGLTAIILIK